MTLIDKEFEGDAFFPKLDESWVEISSENNIGREFNYKYLKFQKN